MTEASTPRVSVIIPCYNAERFIRETIECALTQTHPNVEVVVVNDGSTDNSLGIIQSFGNRVIIQNGPNRGACAARNAGFARADGDWIHFLDADDLLHSEKIAVSLRTHTAHPDAAFVWSPLRHIPSDFRLADVMSSTSGSIADLVGMLETNALLAAHAPATSLFKRSFLAEVGDWDICLRRWTDLEYHARLAARLPSYVALPEPLYFYRQHDSPRISDANKNYTGLANGRLALERARLALEATWPDKAELARYLAPMYLNLARSAAANSDATQFRELLKETDRLRGEWRFHLKCQAALACASLISPKATSALIDRALGQQDRRTLDASS